MEDLSRCATAHNALRHDLVFQLLMIPSVAVNTIQKKNSLSKVFSRKTHFPNTVQYGRDFPSSTFDWGSNFFLELYVITFPAFNWSDFGYLVQFWWKFCNANAQGSRNYDDSWGLQASLAQTIFKHIQKKNKRFYVANS